MLDTQFVPRSMIPTPRMDQPGPFPHSKIIFLYTLYIVHILPIFAPRQCVVGLFARVCSLVSPIRLCRLSRRFGQETSGDKHRAEPSPGYLGIGLDDVFYVLLQEEHGLCV